MKKHEIKSVAYSSSSRKAFYIPVENVREAKKILDILAAYDLFQFAENIKPDFANESGVQQWNEEEKEWEDWDIETEDEYFDSVDVYFENDEEIQNFTDEVFSQVNDS